MVRKALSVLALVVVTSFSLAIQAAPQSLRWSGAENKISNLSHLVQVINSKTGFELAEGDFLPFEDRDLANNHFKMYVETAAGIPLQSMSLRVWTDLKTGEAIQVEALVDSSQKIKQLAAKFFTMGIEPESFTSAKTMNIIRLSLTKNSSLNNSDTQIRSVIWKDIWEGTNLVRIAHVKGRRGQHLIRISTTTGQVLGHEYSEFPQGDEPNQPDDELSVKASVYPIYEEPDKNLGHIQARIPIKLTHLKKMAGRTDKNIYEALKTQRYIEDKFDPVLGETESGRAQGFWAMSYIKRQAAFIRQGLAPSPNTIDGGGTILEGKFATISLHPDVVAKFPGISFKPMMSAQFKPNWVATVIDGKELFEMIPGSALLGRPLMTEDDALDRVARRLANHDPTTYIDDGFDEVQVYYAINTLMQVLHDMGFSDPELSTRPFNAFLYDPDISMRDNAFYTDDTINFTTYSPENQNFARDNSTIWHELGHGVMDRLMGDHIVLADTGGLSEGMADFVAALVIANVTDAKPFEGSDDFRIINKTGFLLTNEVHDDGEAYGGAMKDFLDAAIARYGALTGTTKVTDVILEAMRLSRNNPGLTAQDWFNHVLFADQLGHEGIRTPGELSGLVTQALAGRNFTFDGKAPATYTLKNGGDEVTSRGPGSRNNPIRLNLGAAEKASFHMNVNLASSEAYRFEYPVTIKVFTRSGPLQGAVNWEGESDLPFEYTLDTEKDVASFDLTAFGKCDSVNQEDGTCKDYAYIQVWPKGATKPVAKKRFYLRIKTK